ncbi:MAG: hypothetical protein GY714_12180 [Desulfobacterales bacterium]|nr:hypothetical protein [Desulfobacterales bacterium]MCP4160049.1 hypothetical protein [Deltaproteobacteria bacterium]
MIIPEVVAGYKVFYGEGSEDMLGVADVTLPDIEPQKVELGGVGLLGKTEIPLIGHIGALNMTIKFRTITNKMNVFAKPVAHIVSLRGGIQVTNSQNGIRSIQDIRIDVVGSAMKTSLGKFLIGEGTDSSVDLSLTKIKVLVDSFEFLEIDKFNNIYKVDGVSVLDDINRAMGV